MTKRKGDESTMSELLGQFISKNKLEKGLDEVSAKDAWATVMGVAIVKYTTQLKLDRETLYVQLSSSVLREELSYGKEKIITLLNEELGRQCITKLVLR